MLDFPVEPRRATFWDFGFRYLCLDSQTQAANNAYHAIVGFGEGAEEIIPKVDLSKYSLEELHDIAAKLDGKEVGIDIKVYGYADAMQMLADVQAQIGQKQNDLNTETGINSEIQNLKKLRGEAQLGSQAWKDDNTQIGAFISSFSSLSIRSRASLCCRSRVALRLA